MKRKMLLTGTVLAIATLFAACGADRQAGNPPQNVQQTDYMSVDAAQAIAFAAANVAASDAVLSSAVLEEVSGEMCYKVAFTSGDNAYAYSIQAISGEVLEASCVDNKALSASPAQNVAAASGVQDGAKAQEIALKHAGVKAEDATITKNKLDYEDGQQVYEIEWYANGAKYEYEIMASDGTVVKSGYEGKTVVGTGSGVAISEAAAKQTALARVEGATEKDIYEWKFDYDDGRPEYEGKIIYANKEHEFTIDAVSGAITEYNVETLNR